MTPRPKHGKDSKGKKAPEGPPPIEEIDLVERPEFVRAADRTLWLGPWRFDEKPLRLVVDPPLDLGLRVSHVTEWRARSGVQKTGDPSFDQRHAVESKDYERANKFLHEELRRALVSVRQGYEVIFEDEGLLVDRSAQAGEAHHERAVDIYEKYLALARAIDLGRALAPPSDDGWSLFPAWEALAARRKLQVWRTPVGASGRVGDTRVRAGVWRKERAWAFRLSLRSPSLDVGLSLVRASVGATLSAPFRRGAEADHDVGEAAFDRTFDVRTTRPELLATLLDAPARQAVQSCAAILPAMRLHDEGLEADAVGDDAWAAQLPGCLESAIELLGLLAENVKKAPPPPMSGPYR